MKDYKPVHDSLDDRRARAIGLAKSLGIWRGQVDCQHRYTNSLGQVTTVKTSLPRVSDMPDGRPF